MMSLIIDFQKVKFLKWLRRVYGRIDEADGRSNRPVTDKLVIIEVGCGHSIHSLRFEVDSLIASHRKQLDAASPLLPQSMSSSSDLSSSTSTPLSASSRFACSSSPVNAVTCVRINPNCSNIAAPNVGLPMGAQRALEEISTRLHLKVPAQSVLMRVKREFVQPQLEAEVKSELTPSFKKTPRKSSSPSQPRILDFTTLGAFFCVLPLLSPYLCLSVASEDEPNLCSCHKKVPQSRFKFFVTCGACGKCFHNTCAKVAVEMDRHWSCVDCKERKRSRNTKHALKEPLIAGGRTRGELRRSSSGNQ